MFTSILAIGSVLLGFLTPIVFLGLLISKIFGFDLGSDIVWFGGLDMLGVFTTPIFMGIGTLMLNLLGRALQRLGL